MTYKKSIVIFITLFMCFSLLLKHGLEMADHINDLPVIVDMNNSVDDIHEIQVDDTQASVFESNDDFILTILSDFSSSIKFSLFYLAHIQYSTPTQLSLLRPPSSYLS
jgi:hypothetical protein